MTEQNENLQLERDYWREQCEKARVRLGEYHETGLSPTEIIRLIEKSKKTSDRLAEADKMQSKINHLEDQIRELKKSGYTMTITIQRSNET